MRIVRETKAVPFGKYELLECLGTGGMAAVYRARYMAAPGVTKPMVIKRVLTQYAEHPAFVEMFIQEARVSVGLSHGNIVQVFDFGQVEGEYFLAMELVEGQPLSRVLKRAQSKGLAWLPAPLAVSIAIEMCKGLHHAHTRTDESRRPLGLVHRDISPDNVLVSYEGDVKISDFGIAKARLAGRQETEAGVVKGKYLYLSPEQALGLELDARSDVYSVGVVLYRMLCGHLPAEGRQMEVLERIVKGRLVPLHQNNPAVDGSLAPLVDRVLSTRREARPESAEVLRLELTRWLAQRAPLFAANTLKHVMEWLYTPELVARGTPPVVTSGFQEQLALWTSVQPPRSVTEQTPLPPMAPEPPDAETAPAERVAPPPSAPTTSVQTLAAVKGGGAFIGWALAGVVGVGLVGILWQERNKPEPLEIRSEPPGAQVRINGEIHGVTPVVVDSLDRDQPHRVELLLLGRVPWEQEFAAGALAARLEVSLEDVEPRPQEPSSPQAPVEEEVDRFGTRQVPASFTLSEALHSFGPALRSLRVELNPRRTYAVWTTGKYSFGERRGQKGRTQLFRQASLFLEGPDLSSSSRLLPVSSTPRFVTGASALHAFVLFGDSVEQNEHMGFFLNVREGVTGKVFRSELNPRRFANQAALEGRYTVRQLDPKRRYQLGIRSRPGMPSSSVAMVALGGEEDTVQVSSQPGGEVLHVLAPGAYTVTGARELWFALPRWKEDGESELDVNVSWVSPPTPKSSLRVTAAANPSPATAAEKYKQARDKQAKKQFQKAKELFWECLANDSSAAQCFHGLGEVSVQLGNGEEAVEYYGRFLELAPDSAKAQEARDYITIHRGRQDG
ncbi:protein kinase domain-containing protein [Stigmatella aurantiaca]|uniref:Serine/threonine-protein kinase n=1 Tax=Stigmatella aurantiaca (strain DW4/3-1) TaxID=378806 RepID=Q08N18_STIAD|nr:protein kinase [Stigmatella aurantiaca]ADO73827.1 Serine/threonine-protein kinase [Stigmatella aurantiaca DW4/3-1]EAU61876.1 serine/threonine-protein kinase Pkn6 [Stigmatella aurantiaca DW4/3-1]